MSDKPIAYFKATEKHGILWSEDCCCADPIYGDYEDYEGHQVINLAVYPASAYEALQKELESKNQHLRTFESELVKSRLDIESLKKKYVELDKLELKALKERDDWQDKVEAQRNEVERQSNKIANLKAENEAQAKRIEELESEDEISAAVIEKCSYLLSSIAITLKGEQKELSRYSHHDLPELVSVLYIENELNKQRIAELETPLNRHQILSACLSYRHDFGLMELEQQAELIGTAKNWEACFQKEREFAVSERSNKSKNGDSK